MKNGNGRQNGNVESSDQSREPGKLIPQPHGGALQVPYKGMHNGGPGRTPDMFRAACREAFARAKGLDVLVHIASGDILELLGQDRQGQPIIGETKNRDRIGALEFLVRIGWPGGMDPEDVTAMRMDWMQLPAGERVVWLDKAIRALSTMKRQAELDTQMGAE